MKIWTNSKRKQSTSGVENANIPGLLEDQKQNRCAYTFWKRKDKEDATRIIAINLKREVKEEITLGKTRCGSKEIA